MTRQLMVIAVVLGVGSAVLAQEPTDRPAVYTAEQASLGLRDLQRNSFGTCSNCHAADLTGRSGEIGELPLLDSLPEDLQKTIRDNFKGKVPPLAGLKFMTRWGPRSTRTLSADFQRRFDAFLSEETQLNIIAYVLQVNGALPGPQPLTRATDIEIGSLTSVAPK